MSTVKQPLQSTTVNVTDGREAHPESWYIALTRNNAERTTARRLGECGYETYVPTQVVVRRWSDRLKKIERCIIPMVVFVRTDRNGAIALQRLGIARGLMRAPGESAPATVPPAQIAMLRFMTDNSDSPVGFTPSSFVRGQRVRVIRGRLRGLEGIVTDTASSSTHRTLSLLIDHLGCATLTLPSSDCQPC